MENKQTAVDWLLMKWANNDRMLFFTDFEKALKMEESQKIDDKFIKKRRLKEEKREKEFQEWFSKAWDISINSPDKHAEDWN